MLFRQVWNTSSGIPGLESSTELHREGAPAVVDTNKNTRIAIIGSGPAGLSAAAHAAELGVSHILLEASPAHANTIQRYQKGKLVMAEPGYLPLRSSLSFDMGSREEVLSAWQEGLENHGVNISYDTEVMAISGQQGDFTLETGDGGNIKAEYVVLSIGVQGNLRKLGVEGDSLPFVQYTLDDPDEFQDETIVVIGAGDAAIENALGVAGRNEVYIVNRKSEFSRAKQANIDKILAAEEDGMLTCVYNSSTLRVDENPDGDKPGIITLKLNQVNSRFHATGSLRDWARYRHVNLSNHARLNSRARMSRPCRHFRRSMSPMCRVCILSVR